MTTVVRPWFGRGTSNLARECDDVPDRAYARVWRTCVPFEPRTDVHGHMFCARGELPRNAEAACFSCCSRALSDEWHHMTAFGMY